MTLHRNRRAGLSLVEVIVAMFIMALGMIALLTLFPLGALQMGQALKDDRCATAAHQADHIMRTHWKKYVIERRDQGLTPDPFTNAFTNPQDTAFNNNVPINPAKPLNGNPINTMPNANVANEPSYPVFVDPRGFRARAAGTFVRQRSWVAEAAPANGQNAPRIPRRSLATVEPVFPAALNLQFERNPAAPNQAIKLDPYRPSTLLDDLTYDENASTRRIDSNNAALPVERQGRYTWGWMLQLPAVGNPNFASLNVVVYDNRNPDYPAADHEVVYGNVRSQPPIPPQNRSGAVQYTVGSTSVTFTYAQTDAVPNIRAGGWILDGTVLAINPATNAGFRVRNANFYRVTAVEVDEQTRTVRLDLQTPIKPLPSVAGLPANMTTYNGDLYVLKGVAEVFERKPLTATDLPD